MSLPDPEYAAFATVNSSIQHDYTDGAYVVVDLHYYVYDTANLTESGRTVEINVYLKDWSTREATFRTTVVNDIYSNFGITVATGDVILGPGL